MHNDKRIFAFVSLGLMIATPLVPFFIAALGRDDLALGFGVVAAFLALIFGAFSWKEYIGRTVTIALPVIFLVGLVVVCAIRAQRNEEAEIEQPSLVLPPPAQPAGTPGK